MSKSLAAIAPQSRLFLHNVLPQMLQNVTVVLSVNSLDLGDELMVRNSSDYYSFFAGHEYLGQILLQSSQKISENFSRNHKF